MYYCSGGRGDHHGDHGHGHDVQLVVMITVVLMAMIIDEHFGDDENEVHSSAIVKARILFIMR